MSYQLKAEYLKAIRESEALRKELEKVADITEQTRINVLRSNLPLLVRVEILVWIKKSLQLDIPIEDMIEPKEIRTHEPTRQGVEV